MIRKFPSGSDYLQGTWFHRVRWPRICILSWCSKNGTGRKIRYYILCYFIISVYNFESLVCYELFICKDSFGTVRECGIHRFNSSAVLRADRCTAWRLAGFLLRNQCYINRSFRKLLSSPIFWNSGRKPLTIWHSILSAKPHKVILTRSG